MNQEPNPVEREVEIRTSARGRDQLAPGRGCAWSLQDGRSQAAQAIRYVRIVFCNSIGS